MLTLLICAAAFATPYDEERQQTITLVGEYNCPFNCQSHFKFDPTPAQLEIVDKLHPKHVQGNGYIIEIAKAIYEPLGYRVVYQIMPQEKAKKRVLRGRNTILLNAKKSKKFILPKQAIGLSERNFYTNANTNWSFAGLSSLEMVTLGLVDEVKYPEIADYIKHNKDLKLRIKFIPNKNAAEQNIRNLASGKFSAIYENKSIADYYRKVMNVEDLILNAGIIKSDDDKIYLSFSKANENSKTYAKQYDAGIEALRKTGKLAEILNKYGVEDWEK
jgi:polar amino acid transport system substrate-binding protein